MIQLVRLKNALARIRAKLFDTGESIRSDETLASDRVAELHATCWEAYCLSRCLKQYPLSVLTAESYAMACSVSDVQQHSHSLTEARFRTIDMQLNQAIRQLDQIISEAPSDKWQMTTTEKGQQTELSELNRIAFHAETLRSLILWELSIASIDNDQKVSIRTSESLSFHYDPMSIATFLARLILIVPESRQKSFEVNVEVRGLSVVFDMPLTKSSIVDVLIDPFCHLYFLGLLAESSGISTTIHETGMRLAIPFQMPDRLSLNVDYGALVTIVDLPPATDCCASE